MSRKLFIISCFLLMTICAYAQTWTISGVVTDKATGKPVEYATVVLESTAQWAVAGADGKFTINNVQSGKNIISISCLGYVTDTKEIIISRNIENYRIALAEDNLALEGVVVTAQEKDNTATTSRMIDKNALNHVQMMNVADVSSLLPGGATLNPDLTSNQQFNIRASKGESGNASFGTAVEIDGVRLSNNASFASIANSTEGMKGVNTNNIASSNVESVEVITGVPSVEYGDMTSGVVKINTRKGKTPYMVTMSTNPRTKQVSASKGFALGETKEGRYRGVLNANMEYTKAISNKMSPFTGYDRNQISLTYSNTFNNGIFAAMPLQFSTGITGNIGGMDSKADPDTFMETFTTVKDNTIRGNISLNWLLSKKWITNLELNASVVYSDKQTRENEHYSSSSSSAALHGREEGYFVAEDYAVNPDAAIILIPRGYWYNVMAIDDRPLNYKVGLKANWARQWNGINNKVKVGADLTGDGNFGVGVYSENMATAPSFREYPYNEVPFMNNLALYAEDNIMIPIGKTRLNLIAGIRSDNTMIKGSAYENTSSISPRFNAKYTVFTPKNRRNNLVKELNFRASWGLAVKLPSFSVLFPSPTYRDVLTFTPTSDSNASYYPAYYISPRKIEYNADLKWQRNQQSEIGMEIDIAGYRISLAGFYTKTENAYRMETGYTPFSYNYTSTQNLKEHCTIPVDNRIYHVDRTTGLVTVSDKTGAMATQTIPFVTKDGLNNYTYATNDVNPITRYGIEWTVDFKKIEAINTSIQLDGTYYYYRRIDGNMTRYSPMTNLSADGTPFKYVGIYYGGDGTKNGDEKKTLSTNMTITTRIPKVRMVVSMKVQATLLRYSRYLSERADGTERSFVISDNSNILSLIPGASIYDGSSIAVTYPDQYVSASDLENPRNYLEDLRWAKENDPHMYTDLMKLSSITYYNWYYNKDFISPYFSANISVTKEIGDIASVSFYANNFFNNLGKVKSSKTETYSPVSGSPYSNSSYAPGFFYGLSLRLMF